jgi:hypothetical protein
MIPKKNVFLIFTPGVLQSAPIPAVASHSTRGVVCVLPVRALTEGAGVLFAFQIPVHGFPNTLWLAT